MHAYSGMFGTFLWNSLSDRKKSLSASNDNEETLSAWSHFYKGNASYVNFMYKFGSCCQLPPLNGLVDMVLWKELYLCSRSEQIINDPVSFLESF